MEEIKVSEPGFGRIDWILWMDEGWTKDEWLKDGTKKKHGRGKSEPGFWEIDRIRG